MQNYKIFDYIANIDYIKKILYFLFIYNSFNINYLLNCELLYRTQEFDHPHVLLQKDTGYLKSMVQETGKAMAEVLASIAHDCYQNRGFTAF